MPEATSHTQLIMWTAGFVLAVVVLVLPFFGLLTRSLKKLVKGNISTLTSEVKALERNINEDVKAVEKQLLQLDVKIEGVTKDLDKRKLEVSLYVADKEAAKILSERLQTVDRCDLMRGSCSHAIIDKITMIQLTISKVLENQGEISGLKRTVDLISERQKHVIERMDAHINGHGHK